MAKTPKKRQDSFLGIHFDFHARENTHPVGTRQRPDIFARMLDAVGPDYLQCDSKGHQGLSSYPTKVGNAVPGITVDNLRLLRELTAERGIALYAHHSGLYDMTAVRMHPEWALVDEQGNVSDSVVSVFSPYVHELLIPQLIEIAAEYGLDGAWIDGDCWATRVDYSPAAQMAYRQQTGRECPRPGDDDYEAYREFCREGFRRYVQTYIQAVKAVKPDFQMTSNWMYSAMMPEKVRVPIDFISGDYNCQNSFNSARFHARCIMNQGLPWDLMAWGHQIIHVSWREDDRSTKEVNQTCQEAAVVLALGGGFEFFNHQYDGGCLVQDWAIPTWEAVARFCREREAFCYQSRSIPQVGILYSEQAFYTSSPGLFSCSGEVSSRVNGLIQLCADSQVPCDVIASHQVLDGRLSAYGTVLIPDGAVLEPAVLEKLRSYVAAGGSILLCGPDASRLFGLPMTDTASRLTYIAHNNRMASFTGNRADYVDPVPDEITGTCYAGNYFESAANPMSIRKPYGRGKIGSFCFDLGLLYQHNQTSVSRELFVANLAALYPNRMVWVEGSGYADISLMQKDGKIMVNIVNSAGPHNCPDVRSFNEIPAIGPLTVHLRLPEKPAKVSLEPGDLPCSMTYANGILTAVIERVAIHVILVVTPAD